MHCKRFTENSSRFLHRDRVAEKKLFVLALALVWNTNNCLSQDLAHYIEDRVTFSMDGSSLIHKNQLAFLNFVDGFPRTVARRASTYLERYVEAMNIVINEADIEKPNVKNASDLINVFFGKNYFSGNNVFKSELTEKYKKNMIKNRISDDLPILDKYVLLEHGCSAARSVNNYVIGSTFVVIDEDLPDLDVERCLYLGISYSFGMRATHNLVSPTTMVERNIDVLVHSAVQQCLDVSGKNRIIECVDNTIKASLARKF